VGVRTGDREQHSQISHGSNMCRVGWEGGEEHKQTSPRSIVCVVVCGVEAGDGGAGGTVRPDMAPFILRQRLMQIAHNAAVSNKHPNTWCLQDT
jgi:hypothetical protein